MMPVKTRRLLRYRVLTTQDAAGSTTGPALLHAWMPVSTITSPCLLFIVFLFPVFLCPDSRKKSLGFSCLHLYACKAYTLLCRPNGFNHGIHWDGIFFTVIYKFFAKDNKSLYNDSHTRQPKFSYRQTLLGSYGKCSHAVLTNLIKIRFPHSTVG